MTIKRGDSYFRSVLLRRRRVEEGDDNLGVLLPIVGHLCYRYNGNGAGKNTTKAKLTGYEKTDGNGEAVFIFGISSWMLLDLICGLKAPICSKQLNLFFKYIYWRFKIIRIQI